MESIFDIPAHPLMIHFPVVAIPTLSLIAVLLVARPGWRRKYRLPLVVFAVATVISTILAAGSGEALADAIEAGEYIDTHRSLGEMLRFLVIALGIAFVVMLYAGSPDRSGNTPAAVSSALGLLVVALAVLSLIWVVRTGHEGAKVHWDGYLPASDE